MPFKDREAKRACARKYREANRDILRKKSKKYYRTHQEKMRAQSKKYCQEHKVELFASRFKHPELMLWRAARVRARQSGLLFTITVEDIVIPVICPVLGIPLSNQAEIRRVPTSPSLDRFDSAVGYIPGNIRVISWRANHLKNDGTAEEHRRIADWMEKEMAEKREMIGKEDERKVLPVCEEFGSPEIYVQRIPDIASGADGNDQVESAKVWAHGRVKAIREVQLGDPTKKMGAPGSGNGYLQNR